MKNYRVTKDMSDFCKDQKEEHTSTYYVAYIDILGTKNIVKNDKNDEYLNKLNNIVKNALKDVQRTQKENNYKIFIKVFSDNILFAVKLNKKEKHNSEKLLRILHLAGHLQNRILINGYFARGAITKGNFFIDKKKFFVHGKALINAVSLEENNAIYPRIILHPDIEYLSSPLTIKDIDGFYYLNNYHFASTAILILAKQTLLDKLKIYKDNLKIRQKILWAISYHNNQAIYISSKGDILAEHNKDIITNVEISDILKNNSEKKLLKCTKNQRFINEEIKHFIYFYQINKKSFLSCANFISNSFYYF